MTWNFGSIAETLRDGIHYGFDIPKDIPYDFGHFKRTRDAVIKRLNGIYENNWSKEGIDLVQGTARFAKNSGSSSNKKELEIEKSDGSGKIRVTAPHILIATGSTPVIPADVPGAQHGITSDEFFDIEDLPPKTAIVGAGYIGVELVGILNSIGVETHLFIRGDKFLRKFDPMVQETMTKRYEDVGVKIHKNHAGFEKVEKLSDGKGKEKKLRLTGKDGEVMEVNELLWAIGRSPQVKDLGLSEIGVKQDANGHIVVDEWQNTSVDGIYALGDVTGQAELTPGKPPPSAPL